MLFKQLNLLMDREIDLLVFSRTKINLEYNEF
jgi:hypothetical protein